MEYPLYFMQRGEKLTDHGRVILLSAISPIFFIKKIKTAIGIFFSILYQRFGQWCISLKYNDGIEEGALVEFEITVLRSVSPLHSFPWDAKKIFKKQSSVLATLRCSKLANQINDRVSFQIFGMLG